jgi:hypothetical protein
MAVRSRFSQMNTPDQIFAVLKACRTKPKFPAHVDVDGLDPYNPIHQSDKQKLFEQLHSRVRHAEKTGWARDRCAWATTGSS